MGRGGCRKDYNLKAFFNRSKLLIICHVRARVLGPTLERIIKASDVISVILYTIRSELFQSIKKKIEVYFEELTTLQVVL